MVRIILGLLQSSKPLSLIALPPTSMANSSSSNLVKFSRAFLIPPSSFRLVLGRFPTLSYRVWRIFCAFERATSPPFGPKGLVERLWRKQCFCVLANKGSYLGIHCKYSLHSFWIEKYFLLLPFPPQITLINHFLIAQELIFSPPPFIFIFSTFFLMIYSWSHLADPP